MEHPQFSFPYSQLPLPSSALDPSMAAASVLLNLHFSSFTGSWVCLIGFEPEMCFGYFFVYFYYSYPSFLFFFLSIICFIWVNLLETTMFTWNKLIYLKQIYFVLLACSYLFMPIMLASSCHVQMFYIYTYFCLLFYQVDMLNSPTKICEFL